MAITFVSQDGNAIGYGTSITVTAPAGIQDDDLLIATCLGDQYGQSWTGPAGWSEIDDHSSLTGSGRTAALYYKVASSESGNYEFTYSKGEELAAAIIVLRGADTSTPIDVTYVQGTHMVDGANNALPTNAAITTNTDGAWVVLAHNALIDDFTAGGAPTNYTLRSSELANKANVFIATREISSAGAETPGAWTHTASPEDASDYVLFTIAARPDSDGSVTVTPTLGTVTVTGHDPLVSTGGSGSWEIGAYVYPTYSPPVINATLGTVVVDGFNPEISVVEDVTVSPTLGTITVLGRPPVVLTSNDLQAGLGQVTVTGQNPIITVSREPGTGGVSDVPIKMVILLK